MKMGISLKSFFWVTLCCSLYLSIKASDEDLMDFDFSDLKEIDWDYANDHSKDSTAKPSTEENKITFDDDDDLMEDNQVHPFGWREKLLRIALSRALTNKVVRQKFIEVMPILRVLSKQQRLALSALITAQINAKKGKELNLEQVRMMFGNDRSLILPVVFDIANLVRNSAQKYLQFDDDLADFGDFSKTKVSYERRNLELTPEELVAEENNEGIGTLPATAQMNMDLEEFMSDEVLDPKEINEELDDLKTSNSTAIYNEDMDVSLEEDDSFDDSDMTDPLDINQELQKDVPTLTLLKLNKTLENELLSETISSTEKSTTTSTTSSTTPSAILKRTRRSLRKPKEFVHKLIRSVPLSIDDEDIQRSNLGRALKLNTTAFASPKESSMLGNTQKTSSSSSPTTTTQAPIIITPETAPIETVEPYQLVEDMAFASLNNSEVFLDESKENKETEVATEVETKTEAGDEILPTPEELIAGPRYRVVGNKLIPIRPKIAPAKRKRVQVSAGSRQKPVISLDNGVPAPRKCERFTASMCIKTEDYPIDQIMGSIKRHRNAMTALLAEYSDKPQNSLDTSEDFDDYLYGKKRREDNDIQGGLCQSIVRYARPQKARSASGEWKYIVNTGQHTQTLRLEKCMNPQESCSYLSSSYRSHCAQVYNYHRLLSWDKTRGLHVDIFKVPTCCSCQIDGYKTQFPALASQTKKDFTPIYKSDLYRQHQQLDFNEDDEDEDDDFSLALIHPHHDTGFDANELSSNRVRSKIASPTVGAYLSPPESEEQNYLFKKPIIAQQPTVGSASNKHYRRRPQKSYSDSRSDQEYEPSEYHVERELTPAVAAIATAAALRPSQPAPEPFVASQIQQQQQRQQQLPQQDFEGPQSLIPMPTKNQQLQQQHLQTYQHQSQSPPHHHHQQQPQVQEQPQPQQIQYYQHLYRPTITPAHDMSLKTNPAYEYHTRSRQPTREMMMMSASAKRPIQHPRSNTGHTKTRKPRPQSQSLHRSHRMFML